MAAALLSLLAVGTAPAGNRPNAADADFKSFPGPAEVTFGKNVSYRASLANSSKASYTQIKFAMTRPTATITDAASNPATVKATLIYSSCEAPANFKGPFAGLTETGYTCPAFANLPGHSTGYEVTLIWSTDPLPVGATCGTGQCVLSTVGTWTIKESNDTTPSTDTLSKTATNNLLIQPNPVKSAGYAIGTVKKADCTVETANVFTNLSVGAQNKIATAVCAGTLPGTATDPGAVIEINERAGKPSDGPGFTDVSNICIPAPTFTCPTTAPGSAWTFVEELGTFIFQIQETDDWPNGEKLDLAWHDKDPYTGCTFVRDGKTKIWTVVCPAAMNGDWRFG